MSKAVYAFSGDPITFGHINVVERASKIFEELIVAIGVNPDKKYTFTLEEREEMAKDFLNHLENVNVISFRGLLVDFAYEHDIPVIIKGLRDEKDFNYELVLHQAGRTQQKGIETFFLPADPELMYVSSSVVKELQKEHGEVHKYVSLNVKKELESKISNQFIIGVTGEIGSGKTYTAEKIVEILRSQGIEAHNIELDEIGRQITEELDEPVYINARREIIEKFGEEVKKDDSVIDRKVLGEIVFGDKSKLELLNSILHPLIVTRLRKVLQDKTGIIILNAALFAETNMNYLFNNNVILLSVDDEVQKSRLKERGLTDEQIKRRVDNQFNYQKKKEVLEQRIDQSRYGRIWEFENNGEEDLGLLVDEIKKFFSI